MELGPGSKTIPVNIIIPATFNDNAVTLMLTTKS